jgi:N utilization substance protein B
MRKRSKAREYALQILYQMDITHEKFPSVAVGFWALIDDNPEDEIKSFVHELVLGVVEHAPAIDDKIAQYATNWELTRMAVVDRNILRLSGYELLFRDDIPPKVSINEAVELAKKFSGDHARKFVNGILDKIKSQKQ